LNVMNTINKYKLIKKVTLFAAFCFICAIPATAQNTYTFIGDFIKVDTAENTVTVQAENGAVNIAFIDGIGVQVRYTFDNNFGAIHSYATLDSVLQYNRPEVQVENDYLRISENGITV